MAKQVGTKTGQKTKVGRDVYKTPEGESVSEKSVTIKFGDNAYVNAPSIHDGKRYSEDEIKQMLLDGKIKPTSRHDTLEEALKAAQQRSSNLMKEGGMAKSLETQMELFEDGGLMEEGGMVDEESGNEVPPGSTREEVRDDIPAQLSEGEFVFPADVVRYWGLEKLMQMRQMAKAGLARMEAMGQMGNADEATMPDDLPFDINDIDMEDEMEYNDTMEMARGGVVHAANGTFMTPGTGFSYQAPAFTGTTGFTPFRGTPAPAAPTPLPFTTPTMGGPAYTTATGTTNFPTFASTVGTAQTAPITYKTYVNAAGQTQQIPFQNGQPLYPIPAGFTLQQTTTAATTTTTPTTQTTGQQQDEGGDGYQPPEATKVGTAKVGTIMDAIKGLFGEDTTPRGRSVGDVFATAAEETDAYGGSKQFGFSNDALRQATFDQGRYQAGLLSPMSGIGSAIAKEVGIMGYDMKGLAVAGNQGMNAALNAMGLTNRTQLMNDAQATLVGKAMSAAHAAVKAGKNPQEAVQGILGTQEARDVQRAAVYSIKDAYAEKVGAKGDFTMADFANEMAKEEAKADKLLSDIETGSITDASGKSVGTKIMSKDYKTNQMVPTNAYTSAGIAAKKSAEAKKNQASVLKDSANNMDEGHTAPPGGYSGTVAEDPGFDGGGGENDNNAGPQGDEATGGSVGDDMYSGDG